MRNVMNAELEERLYPRLRAIDRQRDQEVGEALRAVLRVMERELVLIEDDVAGLYENSFIETCEDWVVPYIGDLLGVRVLGDPPHAGSHPRVQVAGALAYRHLKGTPLILERTIHDILGWSARVEEYSHFLLRTPHMRFLRPAEGDPPQPGLRPLAGVTRSRTFDRSRDQPLADSPGRSDRPRPFARPEAFRTVDVRRIGSHRALYNLPNLAVFLWRIRSFEIAASPAAKAPGSAKTGGAGFFFDPLGRDLQLFSRPRVPAELVRRSRPHHLPMAIRREPMKVDPERYYGPTRGLLIEEAGKEVPAGKVEVADLSAWQPPAAGKVRIDPQLGRFMFDAGRKKDVRVRYGYGGAAALGGGPYDRLATLTDPDAVAEVFEVSKGGALATLQAALDAWAQKGKPDAVIRIAGNELYAEAPRIELAAGRRLAIEAADGKRPVLKASSPVVIAGQGDDSELVLNGLWIDGALKLENGLEAHLTHCTLIPRAGKPSIEHAGYPERLRLRLTFCVTGVLRLPPGLAALDVEDSILDSVDETKAQPGDLPGPPPKKGQATVFGPALAIRRSTVFGSLVTRELRFASGVLFQRPVRVERRHLGCVRFSYLPPGSETPRRFRCQPDLAVERATREPLEKLAARWSLAVQKDLEELARKAGFASASKMRLREPLKVSERERQLDQARSKERQELVARERKLVEARLEPGFTSTRYGEAGYAQLDREAARELAGGGEEGSEIGGFSFLEEPRRRAQLQTLLEEYLRFGMDAGVFNVT